MHTIANNGPLSAKSDPPSQIASYGPWAYKNQHKDIRYHYVSEALAEGTIDLQYYATEMLFADILTKPTTKARFDLLHGIIGLQK